MTRTDINLHGSLVNRRAKKAWLNALEMTAPIVRNPETTLLKMIEAVASKQPHAPALLSSSESFSYRQLVMRCNRYTDWALAQGLGREDSVCLFMPNCPEYIAAWLGITATGCTVGLLNTKLVGSSLAHCLEVAGPQHVIVSADLLEILTEALPHSSIRITIWAYGSASAGFRSIDDGYALPPETLVKDLQRLSGAGSPVTINDRALYIYTSGTTGLPKAVNISHGRILQWSLWFAGLMQTGPADRLYNCLPMYHSVGGIVATGPLLVTGGAVVIKDEFSASQFWADIVDWDCTLFQYIGELCRYLLRATPTSNETRHKLRMCVGNGLRPELWSEFKSRFEIPQILEFYAATEGSVSLFNVEEEPGSLGRIPTYLAHRFPLELIKYDDRNEAPLRTVEGFCAKASPDETGEAITRISGQTERQGSNFEGYNNVDATEKKILRNVFEHGDAWFRTGDLMRMDKRGYYYFVDRVGDTFRWKGENVSTSEVERVICSYPGVRQASVYGVSIPNVDGKVGMATIAIEELPLEDFRDYLSRNLPGFAVPAFLRLRREISTTGTFRNMKQDLSSSGYDPTKICDMMYFNDRRARTYVQLDSALFYRIQTGEVAV
jgi:fatty-acyl-CoA synthase